MIHEKAHPDPLNPYLGLSPIAVLARMGDLDNYAADYLRSFFLNAGIPSGILKYKEKVEPEERRRIRELWREKYTLRNFSESGTGGAFDIAVLDGEVDYKEIGSKLRMMDLGQVFGETESRICSTFGVHPILVATYVGLLRSTMDNYRSAKEQLYQMTLLPEWVSTADRFSKSLGPDFGNNIYCLFDLDDVEELQRSRTDEKRLALDAFERGLMMKNEARQEFGLSPDADGDVYKVKLTETYQQGVIEGAPARQQLRPARERLALRSMGDRHASAVDEWVQLRRLAERSTLAVKKK